MRSFDNVQCTHGLEGRIVCLLLLADGKNIKLAAVDILFDLAFMFFPMCGVSVCSPT